MKEIIGFVTIGQSPRQDIISEISGMLGPGIAILERGALDGLRQEKIRKLKPERGDFSLITRLRDGSSVVVGKKKILPLLQRQIKSLEEEPVRLIALLCTDEFPTLESHRVLLRPSRLLFSSVVSIIKKGKVGIFVPLEEQKGKTIKKWKKTGLSVVIEALNPYQESPEGRRGIERMRDENVDLIVLDCIGYSLRTKSALKKEIGKPVLLPRTVLARAIKELL